nr:RagB/SusD family nutrient uptake outer membrane protein [Pedobacter sp. ASV19]
MNIQKITIKTIIHSLLCIVLFSAASCKKILDLKPTDQLDETDVFLSAQKLESAVLGAYQGWYPEYLMRIGSVMADECRLGPRNSGVSASGQNLFRWTYSSADQEILAPWKNAYQVIDRVNRLLNGLDKVPLKNEGDKAKLKQLKGELLAIRAYEHFDLYRLYGASGPYRADAYAVPYMKSSSTSSQPSRSLTGAFFEAFWKDISEAESIMEDGSNIRMGLSAVYALHARAALYTERYPEAVLFAGKVIEKFPLASLSDFEGIWKEQNNAETIFKLKRNNVSSMRPGDLFYNIGAERILFAPALKLLDSYDHDEDVRYKSWFDTDPELITQGDLAETIIKYKGTENAPNRNDVKLFRTGEMYLIRAEAALHNGDVSHSESDLNILRLSLIHI